MAAIERPAVDERMAVLAMSELPGRDAIRDSALDLGSGCWEGVTLELNRARAGEASLAEGRVVRAAPAKGEVSQLSACRPSYCKLPARVFVNRMDILEEWRQVGKAAGWGI